MWCTIYHTYIHYRGEIWENKLLLHLSSRLVEWHRVAQQGVDDVRVVVELLVHHQSEDTHLGSTAVVQLDRELLVDGLLVPAGCSQLGLLDLILAGCVATLDQGHDQHSSEDHVTWELSKTSKTGLGATQVESRSKGGRKSVTSSGDQVAKDRKHGDAAVLGLDLAKAVESVLVGIVQKTQRIPEA